jgi:hypothetical protein
MPPLNGRIQVQYPRRTREPSAQSTFRSVFRPGSSPIFIRASEDHPLAGCRWVESTELLCGHPVTIVDLDSEVERLESLYLA